MGKKIDSEFGSQANLVKNEAGMAPENNFKKQGSLSRTASRTSEFETVSFYSTVGHVEEFILSTVYPRISGE